jgi:hypothetical protein
LALLSKSLLRKPSMFEHYSTGIGAAKESFITHEPVLKNVRLEVFNPT